MPIHEYRCSDCGHKFETLQKQSDPALTVCPSCGKAALVKLISAAGFQLKGSGWYETDFKNEGAPPSCPLQKDGDSGEAPATPACAANCACHPH